MRTDTLRTLLAGFLMASLTGCGQSNDPLTAVGTLEWDRIELSAEVNEPIAAIEAREGQTLAAGQVVIKLDDQRERAELAAAQAARDQAAARHAELQRGPRAERIAAARARATGAQDSLDAAQREFVRKQTLLQRKLVSPQELDQARAQRDTAQAARDSAKADLAEAVNGATTEELEQAKQALQVAEANLRTRQITLERLTLRAPMAARVDALPFELGERPKPGAVIAVLLGGAAPYAHVYVPEQERARLAPGHAAKVYVDGIAAAFDAKVRSISSDPAFTPYFALTERDRSRLSYSAKVELLGKGIEQLPAGVPVRVEFAAY
jgi:HlyD family secretion protein